MTTERCAAERGQTSPRQGASACALYSDEQQLGWGLPRGHSSGGARAWGPVLALTLLCSSFAFAQTAPNATRAAGATESADAQAERFLAEGTILFDRRDFEGARRLFLKAYDVNSSVRVLLNLGVAELNAEHFVDAAEHLRYFVSRMDAPQSQIDAVQNQLLPKAYARVVRVVVEIPSRTKVLLDGVPNTVVGGDENALITTPGNHELKLPDGRSVTFRADAGQIVRVPLPAPPASAVRSPVPAVAPAPGVAVLAPGPAPFPARADGPVVRPAAPSAPVADPAAALWTPRTISLAAGTVLTIAAAASGAVFYAKLSSDQNDIDRLRAHLEGYGESACGAGGCGSIWATWANVGL